MSSNIFEVMQMGPIVFSDEDYGCLITINGSYLNWGSSIVETGRNGAQTVVWRNIDCRPTNLVNGICALPTGEAMAMAEAWFRDEVESA